MNEIKLALNASMLEMLRKSAVQSIAESLNGVQPLPESVGEIFSRRYTTTSAEPERVEGDVIHRYGEGWLVWHSGEFVEMTIPEYRKFNKIRNDETKNWNINYE